jgi:phosphoribosyl 1,2-cyclic phosphodiesterase
MKIKLYGTRGSIPTPSSKTRKTLEFGGNTTCLLVETNSGKSIVLDAGSGIREYGNELIMQNKAFFTKENPLIMLLSHVHWDHIQGIPFFKPMYIPKNNVEIYGNSNYMYSINDAFSNSEPKSIAQYALERQQGKFVFPFKFSEFASNINFNDIELVKDGLYIDGIEIYAKRVNHPEGCYSYKIVEDGKTFVFLTDHEHEPDLKVIGKMDSCIMKWIEGADVLIQDAQYTPEEYNPELFGKKGFPKIGWGHSVDEKVIKMAAEANVKKLILTHHDPEHMDEFLFEREKYLLEFIKNSIGKEIDLSYAKEESKIII